MLKVSGEIDNDGMFITPCVQRRVGFTPHVFTKILSQTELRTPN